MLMIKRGGIMCKIIKVLIICLIAYLMFLVLGSGIKKSEKAECLSLVKLEADNPIAYSAEWQKDMCLNYLIVLER